MVSNRAIAIATFVLFAAVLSGMILIEAEDTDADTKYVTFDVNGDKYVKAVEGGNMVTLPTLEEIGASDPDGRTFLGWDNGGVVVPAGSKVTITADITYTAAFQLTYTLTFKQADGTFIDDITGAMNSDVASADISAIEALAAVIDGKHFIGWYANGSSEVTTTAAITKIKGDITYVAAYETVYKVVFIVEGITIATTDSVALETPEAPARDNYDFKGWFDQDGKELVTGFKFVQDTTFTAKFVPVNHIVTFVYGDDETVFMTETVLHNEKAVRPADLPTGYKGWDFNFQTPILEDTTIRAIADIYYEVTFMAMGEMVSAITVLENTTIPEAQIPAVPDGCTKWDFDFTKVITADTVISAVEIEYCTIDYDYLLNYIGENGHVYVKVVRGTMLDPALVPAIDETKYVELKDKKWDIDMTASPVMEDTYVKITDVSYYKVNFIYGELLVSSIDVRENQCIDPIDIPALPDGQRWDFDFDTPITADTVIRSIEVHVVYNVTFMVEGKQTVTQKSDALAPPSTDREGYTFQGWIVEGRSGIFVDPLNYYYTCDTTFIAVYSAIGEVYNVTFMVEGKEPVTQKSDSLAPPSTDREGYAFQGWIVQGESGKYVDPMTYVYTCDTTFVAVYKQAYTVTFEMEGKNTVTMSSAKVVCPDASRNGYDFHGWYVKGDDSKTLVDPEKLDYTKDTTFVADYSAQPAPFYTDPVIMTIIVLVVLFAFCGVAYCLKTGKIGKRRN